MCSLLRKTLLPADPLISMIKIWLIGNNRLSTVSNDVKHPPCTCYSKSTSSLPRLKVILGRKGVPYLKISIFSIATYALLIHFKYGFLTILSVLSLQATFIIPCSVECFYRKKC